jgi:signal transduction histidine kinase/ActR/RegA family two-component response regulator
MIMLFFIHNQLSYGLNFLLFLSYFFLILQSHTHHKLYWDAITSNKLLQLRQQELDDARIAAQQANRAKSKFLAGLSHEIRTPMNAILGLTDALWHGSLDDTARNQVGIIRRAGRALMALINDILDLSKIEAGRLELEQINFSLRELIQKTVEMMMVSVQEKGLAITCSVDADIPEIIGDPYRLRQIFVNLISNSVKFTQQGEITISAQKVGQEGRDIILQCDIADTGVGIPKDKLAAIFDSFTQADSSTTRKYGGTGLGLTIAQQLARMMGGDIKVKSELGQGSVFSVTIKARASLHPSSHDMVDEKMLFENVKQMQPMNILLVEDNEENQMVIRSYLTGLPVQLDIATNGAEGVGQFKKKKYDLVFMDIRMPVMDGYEATRQIRQFEGANAKDHQKPVAILAFTASIFEHETKKVTEAGCTALLMKPILREEFFTTLLRYGKGGQFER